VVNGRPLGAVLWRRRWTVVLVVVLVGAATGGWLLFAPRGYTATAMITVTPAEGVVGSHETVQELQATVAELASSRPVLREVRTRIGARRSVSTLQREVYGERVLGTALVRINAQDNDRVAAREMANAVADALPAHDPTGGRLRIAGAGRAVTPGGFSSPDVRTAVVAGSVFAVLLAFLAALLRERAVGRVEDRTQLAALGGAPVLATVSRPADPAELPAEDTRSPTAAQFRALRVALEFATRDDPTSVVVVAPATVDAAAAWTVLNLANALAQVEHRVLVIDADFGAKNHHPALKSKGPGLADVLRGSVELRDAVRPTPISGVCVLPSGNLSGASPATLVEVRFHSTLARIENEIDLVLVHAAPLSESDDARVMAAGHALLVTVGSGRVRAGVVRELTAELRRLRLRMVGTVLLGRARRRA
jgi:Mrp family chromosome partitioning ATPase